MKTIKLYDKDAYLKEFNSKVVSCSATEEGYKVELAETAFFPEAGGQTGDTGKIGEATVLKTLIEGDTVYHICATFLELGKDYNCCINFEERFDKMQQHSAEHIISGIAYSEFGINNVGFHLSDNCVTLDFDKPLKDSDIRKIELLANKVVWKNAQINCYYPDKAALEEINYRNRFEITQNIRLVQIVGTDICACCAPHVKSTGEIGIIKILKAEKHKGGVRLYIKCGQRALKDYVEASESISRLSALLCEKAENVVSGVEQLLKGKSALEFELTGLRRQALIREIDGKIGNDYICIFTENESAENMRYAANYAKTHCKIVGIFCKKDKGYSYICASERVDMVYFLREFLSKAFPGGGGGKGEMLQGSVIAEKNEIEDFFAFNIDKF